jgi:hypothetical protein
VAKPRVSGSSGRHCRQDSQRPRVRRVPCALCTAPAALALAATECGRAGACHRARPSRRAASDSRRLMLFKYKLDDTAGDDIKRLKKQHRSAAAYNGMACAGRSWRYGRVLAQMWACSKLNSYRTQERRSAMIRPTYTARPGVVPEGRTTSGVQGRMVSRATRCGMRHGMVWSRIGMLHAEYRCGPLRCALRVACCTLRVARCALHVARCALRVAGSSLSVPPRCVRRRSAPAAPAVPTLIPFEGPSCHGTRYPPGPTAFPHCIALAPIARDAAAAYGSAVRVCCIMVAAPTAAMQRVRRRAADTVRRGGRCSTRRR